MLANSHHRSSVAGVGIRHIRGHADDPRGRRHAQRHAEEHSETAHGLLRHHAARTNRQQVLFNIVNTE